MSICFCSILKPSFLNRKFGWTQHHETDPLKLSFNRKSFSLSSSFKAIHAEGVGVVYPDDTVSERTSPLEDSEPHGAAVNGVVGTSAEESRTEIKSKKFENVEEIDKDNRFKLRNGREVLEEKAYIVGLERKGDTHGSSFSIEDSLGELTQLADTAGLLVVGSTYQKLASPNPRTYIGSGKVGEIKSAIHALDVETVIFDDELSPGQLRNLEKIFGGDVRVCDRTALILDIFNQRAATREASLQVSLAQMEYQLPRLTRMWTHLERQSGGQVKGMGEKQIEVDKRILRDQIGALKKEIESVRKHREQYRNRRSAVPVPVVSLVGYTNAGKSTLLNRLTGADVLAEDKLFATLDPTTRRMKSGKEFLLTDTVGFIQKLPTTLVAAFRATLEEIAESSLIVHVVDISHPLAEQQIEAVDKVLAQLDTSSIPKLMVWNKVDNTRDPEKIKNEAKEKGDVVCISALTGEGLDDFCDAVQDELRDMMVWVEALIPFDKGELLSTIHQVGMVEKIEYVENGALVRAHVPLRFARLLTPMRQTMASYKPIFSLVALAFLSCSLSEAFHGSGFGHGPGSYSGLTPEYYMFSCPQANEIIMSVLEDAIAKDSRMAASLLRLHFHDCFVQGCDASVLLDDSTTIVSEKNAGPNKNSIRGLEVIDEIKAKLEEVCPHTVSCADILALTARDSIVLSGGPHWEVPLGRKDSRTASLSKSNSDIPAPNSTIQTIINQFIRQGLDIEDVVALSGGHTIGVARCVAFRQRLYNQNGNNERDETLEINYYNDLKTVCPKVGGDNNISPLDFSSPVKFDNNYFKLILLGKGLLNSDEVLLTGNVRKTMELVRIYAENEAIFFFQFAKSMVKMGNINPLLGSNGEVRKNCRRLN
ncbi:hypothetical protein ACJIZ3_002671 [Penstemon smallii]|uniref:peroxidase n=1 Tax=Penstemon smallii TaxID=265156 RepID=A0ABD3UAU2_9LAMI